MPADPRRAAPALESTESSSPIITRAVAAALQGEFCASYNLPGWQKLALRGLGMLPQSVGRFAFERFELLSGLDPARLDGLSIERLAAERLQDYDRLPGKFPCITIGAALGGAAAHLADALGGPFLPQAFVTALHGGSPNGDVRTYFERSARLAAQIADQNPGLITIQHYDPVHDGWLTRIINHLRFKLIELPQAYQEFLRQRLQPGGAVCFLDCGAQWLRYRVGERSFFQVGGWGDLSAQEFLEGSERMSAYCRSAGFSHCDWRLPGYTPESGPESEWGCEAGLGQALEEFCARQGYQFVRISLPEPHDYSRLAYQAVARLCEKQGRQPGGVFIEMFSQFDATAVRRGALLPLWLVFNTWDSLKFLQAMRPSFPQGSQVFFSPLSTFTLTPDLVPWDDWEQALAGLDWINTGSRPSHYPADARAIVDWALPLHRWLETHAAPLEGFLSSQELLTLSSS